VKAGSGLPVEGRNPARANPKVFSCVPARTVRPIQGPLVRHAQCYWISGGAARGFPFWVGRSPFLQEDPLPGRSATRARGDRPRRCGPVKTGNCRGRAPVDRRAVAGNSSCADRGPSVFLRRPRQGAVIAERQRGREGPRVYLLRCRGSPVEPTATPSRNDDIQTPVTEEGATLQFDEHLGNRPACRCVPHRA